MANSTILIAIQQNKEVQHFVSFFVNVEPVQELQHYKSRDY